MACWAALQDVVDNTDIAVEFFIFCEFRINCWEVCLNSSRNCLLSALGLGPFQSRYRLVKRVDFSKIQPQKKRAAKGNFIC